MRAISPIIAFGRASTIGLIAWSLVGCSGKPSFSFEGSWLGHRKIVAPPGANPDVVTTLSQVKLQIKPNGRFDLFYNAFPTSGNVQINGQQATLSVTDTIDRSANENPTKLSEMYGTLKLTGQKDGSILFSDSKDPKNAPTRLLRTATKG